MSTLWKIVSCLLVIGILVWGVRYMMTHNKQTPPVAAVAPAPAPTPAPQKDLTDGVAGRDSTDASLSADISTVDAHMTAVDQNSAQVDQSFSDKPVSQTE